MYLFFQEGTELNSGSPTFLKYDPRDLFKYFKIVSKRAFPQICKSLEGGVPKVIRCCVPRFLHYWSSGYASVCESNGKLS